MKMFPSERSLQQIGICLDSLISLKTILQNSATKNSMHRDWGLDAKMSNTDTHFLKLTRKSTDRNKLN